MYKTAENLMSSPKKLRQRVAVLALLLIFAATLSAIFKINSAAAAAYENWGAEQQINTDNARSPGATSVKRTTNGDYIVVWEDYPGSGTNIWAQKVDEDGNILWGSDVQVSNLTGTEGGDIIDVVPDSSGGVFIGYSNEYTDVYVNHVDEDGNLWSAGELQIENTAGDDEDHISLLHDGSDGVYVFWDAANGSRSSSPFVDLTHLDSTGAVDSSWNLSGTGTFRPVEFSDARSQTYPPQIMRTGGTDFLITYETTGTFYAADLITRRMDSAGGEVWGPVTIVDNDGVDSWISVPDGGGGVTIAYNDFNNYPYNIKASYIDNTGNNDWTSTIGTANNSAPFLHGTEDGSGGAIFIWNHEDDVSGDVDIYGQRVNTSGTELWNSGNMVAIAAHVSDQETTFYAENDSIVGDGSGGAFVGYAIPESAGGYPEGVQYVMSDGTVDFGTGGHQMGYNSWYITLASDGAGGAIAVWAGTETSGSSDNNVYGQRLTSLPSDTDKIIFTTDRDGNTEVYKMDQDGSNLINLTSNSAADSNASYNYNATKIAFQSDRDGDSEIYTMDVDGSNVQQITSNSTFDASPHFSPDGSQITFISVATGNSEIYTMDSDGNNQTQLTSNPGFSNTQPSFSPDGTQIVFQSDRDGNTEIYTMDVDGSNETNVSNNAEDDDYSSFTPDGTQITFTRETGASIGIYTMDTNGSNQTLLIDQNGYDATYHSDMGQVIFTLFTTDNEIFVSDPDGCGLTNLTNNGASDFEPSFSPGTSNPQGCGEVTDKVVFVSARDGNNEVYMMDDDGSNQVNLTNAAGNDASPVFNPAGTQIAFTTSRDGNNEIYVMDTDGSDQTNISGLSSSDSNPSFGPGGTQLVFMTDRDGDSEIYIMDSDGSNDTNLTNDPGDDTYPAFSPDGTKVAFSSNRDGDGEIYIMDSDGSNQINLTNDASAADTYPQFSPDGTQITFTTWRDGNGEIYVMDIDGSNQTNLTDDPGEDYNSYFNGDGTQIGFTTGRDGNEEVYIMDADGCAQTNLSSNSAADSDPGFSPGTGSPGGCGASGLSDLAQWPSTLSPASILVNRTVLSAEDHRFPRMIKASDDNYISAWVDFRDFGTTGTDIYAQKLNSTDGSKLWDTDDMAVVTATTDQPDTFIAGLRNIELQPDNAGGAFVAWDDDRGGFFITDVYIQHLDTDGNTTWTADGNIIEVDSTPSTPLEFLPHILPDGNGGVFVTWTVLASGFSDARGYVTHLDSTGAVDANWNTANSGDPVQLPHNGSFVFDIPFSIVTDGSGGMIISYNSTDVVSDGDIYSIRLNADGNIDSNWGTGVQVDTPAGTEGTTEFIFKSIADGNGGVIVAYNYTDTSSSDSLIKAQLIDSSGTKQWGTGGVTVVDNGFEPETPDLASDGDGGAVIYWADPRSASMEMYAQNINSAGTAAWTTNGIAVSNPSDGFGAFIATNGGSYIITDPTTVGNTIMVFTESDGADYMTKAQKLDIDGNALWDNYGENVAETADAFQGYAILISDESTGAVFAWEGEGDFGNYEIYSQHLMDAVAGPVPDAITDLTATPGDGEVTLDWTAPSDNGYPITDYRIEYGTSGYSIFADGVNTNTNVTVTGLTNFVTYNFRVRAINENGLAASSNIVSETPVPCANMDSNTQTDDDPLTTISDQCVGVTVDAGDLSFENIPDSFSFPRKFRALSSQNSFSNDDPLTMGTVDVATGPEDILTVSDFRNNGNGFTVNITATDIQSGGNTIPLANLFILSTYPDVDDLTYDATLNGTQTGGVEYAAGATGTQDITAQVFSTGDIGLANTYSNDGLSFDENADEVADNITLMETSTGHMLRGSLALSFYMNIPASQESGSYSTLLTLDLQPNP